MNSFKLHQQVDAELLVGELRRHRTLDSDGRVSFPAEVFSKLETLVYDVQLNPEIPNSERLDIIEEALWNTAKIEKVTAQDFEKCIRKAERSYLNKPIERFVVCSRLALQYNPGIKGAKLNGIQVVLEKKRPLKYRYGRKLTEKLSLRNTSAPADSLWVRVHCKGRTPHAAIEFAMEDLDYIRGLWTLYTLGGRTTTFSGTHRRAIGRFTLGPVFTIHKPSGVIATNEYWHSSTYYRRRADAFTKQQWASIKAFEIDARRRTGRLHYKHRMRSALAHYANALDNTDWDTVTLRLWKLLEILTGTGGRSISYKKLTRRASFVCRDHRVERQILEQLRRHRNRLVHDHYNSQDLEGQRYVGQLKAYAERLILFHINHGSHFSTMTEACEFLDQPTNVSEIDRRIKRLQLARKFRS